MEKYLSGSTDRHTPAGYPFHLIARLGVLLAALILLLVVCRDCHAALAASLATMPVCIPVRWRVPATGANMLAYPRLSSRAWHYRILNCSSRGGTADDIDAVVDDFGNLVAPRPAYTDWLNTIGQRGH